MWKWLEQYFTFTKGERNAIIVLVALCTLVLIAPRLYFYYKPAEPIDNSKYEKEIEAFAQKYNSQPRLAEKPEEDSTTIKKAAITARDSILPSPKRFAKATAYFDFDPNKIGVAEWIKLGFTERQAESIEKYKAKGGKFYKPTDLKRLYVMTDEHYEKLLPFVKIDVNALPERHYRNRD